MEGEMETLGGEPGAAEVEEVEAPVDEMEAIRSMDAEPETITKWKVERTARLDEKAAAEKSAVAELEASAKTTLEEWDTKYAAKLKATDEKNADGEKEFISKMTSEEAENPWEKVAFMIDFNAKATGKDTSKMKSLLIRLKSDGLLNRK